MKTVPTDIRDKIAKVSKELKIISFDNRYIETMLVLRYAIQELNILVEEINEHVLKGEEVNA
jgi:hypothetical protein